MNSSTLKQNAKLIWSDSASLWKNIQSKIRGKIETKNASRKELLFKLEGTECEQGNLVVCISARRQEQGNRALKIWAQWLWLGNAAHKMQLCMIAAPRGISCFSLLQLWHCLNHRNKRKRKIHSCGILELSDVGGDVPGVEIKAAVSPFSYNLPMHGCTTPPQQHPAIFGVNFPLSSGKWMRRRVLHDTAVTVLFLSAEQWAGCWSWPKGEGWVCPWCPCNHPQSHSAELPVLQKKENVLIKLIFWPPLFYFLPY